MGTKPERTNRYGYPARMSPNKKNTIENGAIRNNAQIINKMERIQTYTPVSVLRKLFPSTLSVDRIKQVSVKSKKGKSLFAPTLEGRNDLIQKTGNLVYWHIDLLVAFLTSHSVDVTEVKARRI